MMITIIVPIRNVEKSLVKCLHSIRHQTYRNLQVFLINNGSIDQSGEICDKFAKNDHRFKVIHTKTKSLSAIKNIGLSLAEGEYVCFVNPVDWINAEMLEELVVSNKSYNSDVVTCRYYEDTISELFLPAGPDKIRAMSKNEAIQLCLSQTSAYGFLCNKLYKTTLFNTSPIIRFDEEIEYYEDLLVAMQCFYKSQTILYSPPPHYHYYVSRHLPVNVLQNQGKLTGLNALKQAIDLLAQDPSIDIRLLKDYYIRLTLSSLFLLVTAENVHGPFITDLRKHLQQYDLSDLQDKDLKRCSMITRRNISLGKIYWDMFYKNKLAE